LLRLAPVRNDWNDRELACTRRVSVHTLSDARL